jgi:hypothetical protein
MTPTRKRYDRRSETAAAQVAVDWENNVREL